MSKKVLVLAPHTDDGELGCGGTIARLISEGCEIFCAAFSTCEESVPEGFEKNILSREYLAAQLSYGIPKDHIFIYHFPVRYFPSHRQEILEELVLLNRSISPDLVFAPSLNDIHQDHAVVAEEAVRAFKKTSILGYELPWNNLVFHNQVFVALTSEQVEIKAQAIQNYETQRGRDYTSREFTFGQARAHGVQIGREYAEVFETVRWIL